MSELNVTVLSIRPPRVGRHPALMLCVPTDFFFLASSKMTKKMVLSIARKTKKFQFVVIVCLIHRCMICTEI
jgi:hypothetical protein